MNLVDLKADAEAFGRLMRRSFATSLFLSVMLFGAVVGYTVRPVADLFWDHPSTANMPVEILGERRTDLPDTLVRVIWPDPTPIKIVPFETANNIAPLVPNIGDPKPVRTFRISPNGNIIDGN